MGTKRYIGELSRTEFVCSAILTRLIYTEQGAPRAACVKIGTSSYVFNARTTILEKVTHLQEKNVILHLRVHTSDKTLTARAEITKIYEEDPTKTANIEFTRKNSEDNFDDRFEFLGYLQTSSDSYNIIVLRNPEYAELFFCRAYNIDLSKIELHSVVKCSLKLARTSYQIEKHVLEEWNYETLKVFREEEEYASENPENGEMETRTTFKYVTVLELTSIDNI